MKTKNRLSRSFWAGAAAVLLLTGCSLDEYNPSGGPTLEEYYSTPEGFGELINGCYFPLTRTWTGGGEDRVVIFAEAGTDLWTGPKGEGFIPEAFFYTGLNGGSSSVDEGWQSSYETINYCNTAIHFAPNAGFKTDAERDTKVAEAHYLRAFFNFFIVEQFGPSFLTTEYTTTPITVMEKATVSEYYDLILSDLKFAIQHLPKVQSDRGRATRAAANHLYAKACLQYAGYDEAPNKSELYTAAKTAALDIINNLASYELALYNTPGEIFTTDNNKNNTEAVWVATHSKNSSLNPRGSNYWNRVYKQFGCMTENGGYCGMKYSLDGEYVKMETRIMPTLALLDLYGTKDARYAAYFREDYIANVDYTWSESDAKKYGKPDSFVGNQKISVGELGLHFTRETVDKPFEKPYACFDRTLLYKDDGSVNTSYAGYGYVALKKFEKPGMYWGELHKTYTYADHYVYRLAETYLLAAEACYRLNDLAGAVTYFNVIRNRACEGHDGSMNIAESDIDVDFILAERARELCGEYTRFMDLKRFGKAVMQQYVLSNPDIKNRNAFNIDVHWVRPIPEKSQLNYLENAEEFQNPGY